MQEDREQEISVKLSKTLMQFQYLYHYGRRSYNGSREQCRSLRPSDVMMLFTIYGMQKKCGEGVTATELSKRMGLRPPSINPVLSVLEKNNLIVRTTDPKDRRFVRITLSEAGKKQVQMFHDRFKAKMRDLVAYLGAEKSSQLADLMNEVYLYCYQQEKSKDQTQQTEKD